MHLEGENERKENKNEKMFSLSGSENLEEKMLKLRENNV